VDDFALSRRDFLERTAYAAGLAGMATLPPSVLLAQAAEAAARRNRLPTPRNLEIDHVVVLMMENRSLDHYLGWLGDDEEYLEAGRSRFGGEFSFDGNNQQEFPGPDGTEYCTYHLPSRELETNPYRGCRHAGPGHLWEDGRAQRDGGFLAEGSSHEEENGRNDEFSLGYYLEEDLPIYGRLARRFTTFDRYHAALLGPTFPNREYLHSAQSGGNKANQLPLRTLGFPWDTIWDRLAAAGVPAAYYFVDLPFVALWGSRLIPVAHHIDRYFEDVARPGFPNVVFIDPGFTAKCRTDDHPFADIRAGQNYVKHVFRAFVESPYWESGVFLLNYDEWGGFFDHVTPPTARDPRADTDDRENFGQLGFRVPCFMASPYAREGWVEHGRHEHASLLRFIEWRFLGAPPEGPAGRGWWLTERDRHAGNIGLALRPDRPNLDLGFDLEQVPLPPPSPSCRDGALDRLLNLDPFSVLDASGLVERVGFTPGTLPRELCLPAGEPLPNAAAVAEDPFVNAADVSCAAGGPLGGPSSGLAPTGGSGGGSELPERIALGTAAAGVAAGAAVALARRSRGGPPPPPEAAPPEEGPPEEASV
jgi:phospholipase C